MCFFDLKLNVIQLFDTFSGAWCLGYGPCGAQCHSLLYNSASVDNHEVDNAEAELARLEDERQAELAALEAQ